MTRLVLVIALLICLNYSQAQIRGCTDSKATNYNSKATQNDGSCIYNSVTVDPVTSWNLPENMYETSGLIIWENKIWTHNDNTDINLYAFETSDIDNNLAYPLTETVNIDWEEISQDESYIYIGDFGNNSNGNRNDLQILRIEKQSVLANSLVIDTIQFTYSMQTDFSPAGANNTDFDCEAFVVTTDSIYLFTKEWVSNKSSIYSLPKLPGEYIAKYQTTYDVQGLISGSTYVESKNVVVLCGYSSILQPFLYLLYDYTNNHYFSGNKRKILLNLPFHLVDGVTTEDGLNYFASNEELTHTITIHQKLHEIDLTDYLGDYITSTSENISETGSNDVEIYPNPSNNTLHIKSNTQLKAKQYSLLDMSGKIILNGEIPVREFQINISNIEKGSYILIVNSEATYYSRKIIKN